MGHFIILTTPRSGSTWLGSLLDDHPEVDVYGELFLNHDVPEKYQELRQNDPEKFFRFRETAGLKRPKVTTAYLDKVFDHSENTVGFKLMATPLIKHPEILLYCKHHNIHVIHLTRNTQDRVISYATAEMRDNFHNLNQQSDLPEKITLEPKKVQKLYKRQKLLDTALKNIIKFIRCPKISIDYDDLYQNTDDTIAKIHEFLDLSPHKSASDLQKSATTPYAELIENYADIEKIFKR